MRCDRADAPGPAPARSHPGDGRDADPAAVDVAHGSVGERHLVAGQVRRRPREGIGAADPAGRSAFIMMSAACASVSSGARVRTTPGEIALIRTPGGPNSAVQARVEVSTALLLEL